MKITCLAANSYLPIIARAGKHLAFDLQLYYIGSAEGHEYPDLQVGDEVNPRTFFASS